MARGLSFAFCPREFVAVSGPSGAGKTTLLRTLAGLQPPGGGHVAVEDGSGRSLPPSSARGELGLVFQHLRLPPNLPVLTTVLCGRLGREPWWRTLFGFRAEEVARARALLKEFGLEGYERSPVNRLSGGEKQRVAIIRALMQRPGVLFADEPVSHLDAKLSRSVLTRLHSLAREEKFLLLCVLHDEKLADELADSRLHLSREDPAGWELRGSAIMRQNMGARL